MARKIRIPDFEKEINKILEEYGDDVTSGMQKAVYKVAEIVRQETKAGSNVGETGEYQKGWSVRKDTTSRLRSAAIIHNRTRYQLAHLLEKGHALRQGGRAPAFPHIAPAEENAIKNMEKAVERIAKGQDY